ncbi:MAG: four helix bundle protein [Phycisphaeraceae bacterium]
MKAAELKGRTRQFAVDVIGIVQKLPRTLPGKTVGEPLIRCGTALGSAYRSACKSRNHYDFAARIAVVEEAADECCYWFEVILATELLKPRTVKPLLDEAQTLKTIFVRSRKSAMKRLRQNTGGFGGGAGSGGPGTMGEDDIPF